jgi:hypothetical protein
MLPEFILRKHLLDDRTQLKTEAEIAVMINKEPMPNVMFDGRLLFQTLKILYLDGISTRPYGNRVHLSRMV